MATLVGAIERLGLKVSIGKTEVAAFTADDVRKASFRVGGGVMVPVGTTMKYLEFVLDLPSSSSEGCAAPCLDRLTTNQWP